MSLNSNAGASNCNPFSPVLVCLLTAIFFLLAYQFDNKYTMDDPGATQGLLVLDSNTLEQHPVMFLTEGWEYYGNRLLTPEDFRQDTPPIPDAYIYIGQYGGFELLNESGSPHGSGSYRLRILLPEEPRTYLLELPEIFSAYRLYINEREAASMGEPNSESYRAEIGNGTVSIEAGGEIELLFAVSDFSHLYSGMVYPPAFGEPEAVSHLIALRIGLRSLVAAFALAIGLLSVLTGLLGGSRRLTLLYGLLCLCFVGFSSYPIVRTLSSGSSALYAAEMFFFCAMLVVVMLLQRQLHGGKEKWSRYFIGFGTLMCLFSASLPLLLPTSALWVMVTYSRLVFVYELLTATFITVTAVRALRRSQPHSTVLLCGFLIFDVALVMDRLLPLHEPIVGGWFYEHAGFALVLCLGGAVGQELAAKYRENVVLTERQSGMERLLNIQKTSYELLMESVQETRTARHDMRHHFRAIDGFLKGREYDRLSTYVSDYQATVRQDDLAGYTQNVVADMLLRHYARLAGQRQISFTVHTELGRETGIADADLCAALSNLLENAVEACERMPAGYRFISVILSQESTMLSIQIKNSAAVDTVCQSDAGFLSAKAKGRIGYGLSSVEVIAERYDGGAEFEYDAGAGEFVSTVLLVGRKDADKNPPA